MYEQLGMQFCWNMNSLFHNPQQMSFSMTYRFLSIEMHLYSLLVNYFGSNSYQSLEFKWSDVLIPLGWQLQGSCRKSSQNYFWNLLYLVTCDMKDSKLNLNSVEDANAQTKGLFTMISSYALMSAFAQQNCWLPTLLFSIFSDVNYPTANALLVLLLKFTSSFQLQMPISFATQFENFMLSCSNSSLLIMVESFSRQEGPSLYSCSSSNEFIFLQKPLEYVESSLMANSAYANDNLYNRIQYRQAELFEQRIDRSLRLLSQKELLRAISQRINASMYFLLLKQRLAFSLMRSDDYLKRLPSQMTTFSSRTIKQLSEIQRLKGQRMVSTMLKQYWSLHLRAIPASLASLGCSTTRIAYLLILYREYSSKARMMVRLSVWMPLTVRRQIDTLKLGPSVMRWMAYLLLFIFERSFSDLSEYLGSNSQLKSIWASSSTQDQYLETASRNQVVIWLYISLFSTYHIISLEINFELLTIIPG